MRSSFLRLVLLLAVGVTPPLSIASDGVLDPHTAVQQAAESSSGKVSGTFEFVVRGTGRAGDYLFLNSEQDYRSPTCLTVAIRRSLWSDVKALAGGDIESFEGRSIRVEGTAERVRIRLPTDAHESKLRWYYQTHVRLRRAAQLSLVEADARPM